MPERKEPFKRVRSSAVFEYQVGELDGIKYIWIVDLQSVDQFLIARTVTNDIENVLHDISQYEDIILTDYVIVYCDSMGVWDGWDHEVNGIIHLGGSNAITAMQRFIGRNILRSIPDSPDE